MNTKTQNKMPIRRQIINLEKGETVDFPISKMSSVRQTACIVAAEQSRKYKCSADREAKTITVIRID